MAALPSALSQNRPPMKSDHLIGKEDRQTSAAQVPVPEYQRAMFALEPPLCMTSEQQVQQGRRTPVYQQHCRRCWLCHVESQVGLKPAPAATRSGLNIRSTFLATREYYSVLISSTRSRRHAGSAVPKECLLVVSMSPPYSCSADDTTV